MLDDIVAFAKTHWVIIAVVGLVIALGVAAYFMWPSEETEKGIEKPDMEAARHKLDAIQAETPPPPPAMSQQEIKARQIHAEAYRQTIQAGKTPQEAQTAADTVVMQWLREQQHPAQQHPTQQPQQRYPRRLAHQDPEEMYEDDYEGEQSARRRYRRQQQEEEEGISQEELEELQSQGYDIGRIVRKQQTGRRKLSSRMERQSDAFAEDEDDFEGNPMHQTGPQQIPPPSAGRAGSVRKRLTGATSAKRASSNGRTRVHRPASELGLA